MTSAILDLDLPPDHPLRQILDTIAAHPEVREPLLRALLTEDFLGLPAQVQELSGRVDGVAGQVEELRQGVDSFKEETREQFRVVNTRIDETNTRLGEANARIDENTRVLSETNTRLDENTRVLNETNTRLDENTRVLSETNTRLDENTRVLNENTVSTKRLEGHMGRVRGLTYEDSCRYYIGVILDGYLVSPVLANRELINDQLRKARRDNRISREEYDHGLSPDIIAREEDDEGHAGRLAVVEASVTFNRRDLETAANRAAIIANVTGVPTAAFVATHYTWPSEMSSVAQQLGVTIIRRVSDAHADE